MVDCEDLLAAMKTSVLNGAARTDAQLRRAAAEGREVPEDLRALVDKIHRHAYRVTDEDLASLKAKYSDDELFEIVVAAAIGAGEERLRAALAAVEAA